MNYIEQINTILRKSKDNIDNYSKLFLDIPSAIVTKHIIKYPWVTPNRVTIFGLLMGIMSSVFIFFGIFTAAAIGLYIAALCDYVDGKIARLKNNSTMYGKRLDIVSDRLILVTQIISYALIFFIKNNNFLCFLLMMYLIVFLLIDFINLTEVIERYGTNGTRDYPIGMNRIDIDKYNTFFSFRRWVPQRHSSFVVLLVLGPILNIWKILIFFYLFWHILEFFRKLTNFLNYKKEG